MLMNDYRTMEPKYVNLRSYCEYCQIILPIGSIGHHPWFGMRGLRNMEVRGGETNESVIIYERYIQIVSTIYLSVIILAEKNIEQYRLLYVNLFN